MGAKLKAFEDPDHEGNSAAHHTGKPCIERDCQRPAGTAWSHLWCHPCNVARMRRIDSSLRRAVAGAAGPAADPVARMASFTASHNGVVRRPSHVDVSPPPGINDDSDNGTA